MRTRRNFSFQIDPKTGFTPGSYFNVLKSSTVGFRTIAVTRAIKLTQIIMHKKWIYLNYFPFFSISVRLLLFNVAISRCLLNFCVKFNYSQIRVFVQHQKKIKIFLYQTMWGYIFYIIDVVFSISNKTYLREKTIR